MTHKLWGLSIYTICTPKCFATIDAPKKFILRQKIFWEIIFLENAFCGIDILEQNILQFRTFSFSIFGMSN